VPADGFYEWKHVGKKKHPYFFRKAGGGLLAYAGVWDSWNGPDGLVESVAVLTVPANDLVKPLHDRMPAIVTEDRFAAWLDPMESRPAKLLPLLAPYPMDEMESWPVSARVNAATTDEPTLLLPVPEPSKPKWIQPTLFDVA
jgi:putative SOS response-associated peptidase YedK